MKKKYAIFLFYFHLKSAFTGHSIVGKIKKKFIRPNIFQFAFSECYLFIEFLSVTFLEVLRLFQTTLVSLQNINNPWYWNLGPVVQSVVNLMSSLRVILLTVFADSIHNILIFFAGKMWVAFALQKLLTFFQQKISAYLRFTQCKF